MFSAMKEHLLAQVVTVAGIAIVTWISSRIGKVLKSLEKKYNIEIDDKAEEVFKKIVVGAVRTVYQTYVEGLKAKGKFTPKKQAEALKKATVIIYEDVKNSILDNSIIKKRVIENEIDRSIAEIKRSW